MSDEQGGDAVARDQPSRLDRLWTRMAWSVRQVAMEFGPADYPEDGGVAFRNEVLAFVTQFINVLEALLEESSTDPWTLGNRERVNRLSDEALLSIAASCHFYNLG